MPMHRRPFLLSLAALPLYLKLGACSPTPALSPLPAGSRVLALGDSVTYGTGAGPGEDWPSLLATRTGWQIENAGIPGDTAAQARERLPELLQRHAPELVLVELGGNDFLRRRPAAQVKEDLRHILETIRQHGAQAVLIGVPELSLLSVVARRPDDAPLYQELAEEEKLPLIAGVFSSILAQPSLVADPIHPNAAGYQVFAQGVETELRKLGLLAQR